MEALTIGAILCVEIGKFSIANYLINKAADIGTGKLWGEVKKQFDKKISIEAKLYNAIEASVAEEYNTVPENTERIAPVCEKIYSAWIIEGRLLKSQVDEAFGEVDILDLFINKNDWYNIFYKKIVEDDELYRWFCARASQECNNQVGKNQETLEQINRILEEHSHELENIKVLLDEKSKVEKKNKEKRRKYEEQMIKRIYCPVFEETCSLRDIYISLMGKCQKRNVLKKESVQIVDTTSYVWEWFQGNYLKMLFLHGEPGSGKSSLVKMIAATIASSNEMNGMVVFIDLHRLAFSSTEMPLKVVEIYIKEHTPWFFDEDNNETRLLILDGLDEIKYNVYENALNLVRELENCNWDFPYKIIVSGRTQIVLKSIEDIRCEELKILPLYLYKDEEGDIEKKQQDIKNVTKQDLRQEYWNTLNKYFKIQQDMPLSNAKFNELSRSPLILFLIVWTIKNGKIQLSELNNTAELYEKIFYYVYTRSHNRDLQNIYFRSGEYLEYQQMLKNLGGCAFRNNSRSVTIGEIYEYCKVVGNEDICGHWIQKSKEDNPSKLVLFFFFQELQNGMDWDKSEIVFIHKSFYEYLGANAIIEFIYKYTDEKYADEYLTLMVFLLCRNKISDEISNFIYEIVKNNMLEIDEVPVTAEKFGIRIKILMQLGFNADYPLPIENKRDKVYSYEKIKEMVDTYETNIKTLFELSNKLGYQMNLTNFYLENIFMNQWKFDKTILRASRFKQVSFNDSCFDNCTIENVEFMEGEMHAKFRDCHICNTFLGCVHLEEAVFNSVEWTATEKGTGFIGAYLQGTDFYNTKFKNILFCNTLLIGANLKQATFEDVEFDSTNLNRADLSYVTLDKVKWKFCKMENTILRGVKLVQFDLTDQKIIDMLAQANLTDVDWSGVDNMTKDKLLNLYTSKHGVNT